MYGYYKFLNVLKKIIGELYDFLSSKDVIQFIHTCLLYFLVFVTHLSLPAPSGTYSEDRYF